MTGILFLTRYGEHMVGAPSTFHGFEQEVAKLATCKWAGEGYPDYKEGETIDETVTRVMPDADWVIANKNTLLPAKENRKYRVGVMLSDLHAKFDHNLYTVVMFREYLKTLNYDAYFMKYMEVHNTRVSPHIFKESFNGKVHHLPWSIDPQRFTPKEKNVDAAFLGAVGGVYPLRVSMWEDMYHVCRGYKIVKSLSPPGKTFTRDVNVIGHEYVGDKYSDLLNNTRIMLFGSSKYRYPVQKYFESAASGCVMLADKPTTAKRLGLKDRVNFVDVNEYDWRDEAQYYLQDADECLRIGEAARLNAVTKHTHAVRAKEFMKMIK